MSRLKSTSGLPLVAKLSLVTFRHLARGEWQRSEAARSVAVHDGIARIDPVIFMGIYI